MKKIEAIIRPERLNNVKSALEEIGILGLTISDVQGRGQQKGLEFVARARKFRVDLLPKKLLTIVVPDGDVDRVIDAIVQSARTGEPGDGKIFVSAADRSIRIRTGEEGDQAI